MQTDFRNDRPLGYQRINGLVASTALTVPAGAVCALITTETQACRWRDDGTAPTASIGYPLAVGAELEYTGQLDMIRFIEAAATAVLHISYYGFPR
jgi:hypothetical protein